MRLAGDKLISKKVGDLFSDTKSWFVGQFMVKYLSHVCSGLSGLGDIGGVPAGADGQLTDESTVQAIAPLLAQLRAVRLDADEPAARVPECPAFGAMERFTPASFGSESESADDDDVLKWCYYNEGGAFRKALESVCTMIDPAPEPTVRPPPHASRRARRHHRAHPPTQVGLAASMTAVLLFKLEPPVSSKKGVGRGDAEARFKLNGLPDKDQSLQTLITEVKTFMLDPSRCPTNWELLQRKQRKEVKKAKQEAAQKKRARREGEDSD